ncbi:MAG: hypothetical protein JNK76_05740 [Planctomycetales bacterium]|nr:hypothetical protein [Planctomycetales bacterium]MBN8623874.1 hypothetical protein [Planctomycetota bacterium]
MNSSNSNPFAGKVRASDELLWTAYQYSVGELDDSAAAAFEERMASDPSACEALAEAVALGEVVRVSFEQSSFERGSFERAAPIEPAKRPLVAASASRSTIGWWAIVTAASVALVVAWQTWRKPADAPTGEVAAAQRLEGLAEADSQLLAALGPEHRWDAVSPLVDELVAADEVLDEVAVIESGDEDEVAADPMDLAAPDWLLAAVAESSSDATE